MKPKIHFAGMALDGRSGHETGRLLLAKLYKEAVGTDMPEIAIAPGGKPYFVGENWHFSISHTKAHVFCVLADRPVGLDAEEADRSIDLRLAEHILSPGEKAQFDISPDPRKTLLTFWVLKEAEGKRTGKGIGFHPRHTDFTLPDDRVFESDGCIVAVIDRSQEDYYVI